MFYRSKNRNSDSLSISEICTQVYRRAALISVGFGCFVMGTAIVLHLRASVHAEQRRLITVAPIVASALSGEIFIGDERAIRALLPEQARKYSLASVEISTSMAPCKTQRILGNLQRLFNGHICQGAEIKGTKFSVVLKSEVAKPVSSEALLALLLIASLVFSVGWILPRQIKAQLDRAVVVPLQELANNPGSAESVYK